MEKKVSSMAIVRHCFLFAVVFLAAGVLQSQTIQARQWLNTDDDHHKVEEEADTELEMQLHKLNKPPIKTIQSRSGELFDCIDVYKQPALDHPLLKNHTVQLRPSSFPIGMRVGKARPATDYGYNESCPEGTVLIKRIQKQDLIAHRSLNKYVRRPSPRKYNTTALSADDSNHFATMQTRPALYNGARAQMIVYGLGNVGKQQASQSSIYVIGGIDQPPEVQNFINAGWHVIPSLYNGATSTRFYTRWTKDDFKNTGCWNTFCQGFVQVSGAFAPGTEIHDLSIVDGVQKFITITIFKDYVSSNWYVTYGDNAQEIGYFPKELFNNFDISDEVYYGGQVVSPPDQPSPPMGSGYRWGEGENRTAYFMNAQLINPTNNFYTPRSSTVQSYADIPAFYSVGDRSETDSDGFKFAYGGPGGYTK